MWSISFVNLKGNCAAHSLANFSLKLYEEKVWIEDTPNIISSIVLEEHSNIYQ